MSKDNLRIKNHVKSAQSEANVIETVPKDTNLSICLNNQMVRLLRDSALEEENDILASAYLLYTIFLLVS
jgi:hypothetical protein